MLPATLHPLKALAGRNNGVKGWDWNCWDGGGGDREGSWTRIVGEGSRWEVPPPQSPRGAAQSQVRSHGHRHSQPQSTPTPPHPDPPSASPTLNRPPQDPARPFPLDGEQSNKLQGPSPDTPQPSPAPKMVTGGSRFPQPPVDEWCEGNVPIPTPLGPFHGKGWGPLYPQGQAAGVLPLAALPTSLGSEISMEGKDGESLELTLSPTDEPTPPSGVASPQEPAWVGGCVLRPRDRVLPRHWGARASSGVRASESPVESGWMGG